MPTNLVTILEKLRSDIPHFISTDLVEIDSGMSIGGVAADPNFDGSAAAACYAEVVKANARALELLGMGSNATEDIVVTTTTVYLLLRMVGHHHYLGVAITRQGTLGFARTVMQKYVGVLTEVIR